LRQACRRAAGRFVLGANTLIKDRAMLARKLIILKAFTTCLAATPAYAAAGAHVQQVHVAALAKSEQIRNISLNA
jgi:hypothetical protein